MPNELLKRLARTIPYTRRVHDGLQAMRSHIAALEASNRVLHVQLEALQSRDAKSRSAAPPSPAPRAIRAVHAIEQAWCDAGGVCVEGWAHAGPHPVRQIALSCDGERVETGEFRPRPDVLAHYPDLPPGGAAGFRLYLACPAYQPLTLSAITDAGSAELPVRLPVQRDAEPPDSTPAFDGFMQAMKARRGTVLEMGARAVGSMTQGWRSRYEPECRYLGLDVHPGPGIDIVADVHALTASVAPGSLDGVFSVAVLEHLAAPWLAAAEINRALRMGGETVHVTHQSWPLHETPNDFFRMSDQALRSLFGPMTGFEVVACGMAFPVAIVPPAELRHADWLTIPFGRGFAQSYIRARKVAELDPIASPWAARELGRISKDYPQRAAPAGTRALPVGSGHGAARTLRGTQRAEPGG